jgi:alanyl-tRNA synthetase
MSLYFKGFPSFIMRSDEIRRIFLDFFRQNGHEVISSSPLIPVDDPTLLFTNAGMVQFKSVFLGDEERSCKRAATAQKCLRVGGKHNDLESVGRTARHHTFFEMLGNFSFGDYFKNEAIRWAWEFLTGWVSLPEEKLIVTIYEKDEESASIWQKETDVKAEKIVRLTEKDNFWQMGDTGPCGPCSEILLDQGPAMSCGRSDCRPGCDCDRYLEIWNLVFMQYSRDSSGELTPLPSPSIDTGMGIERLSAALQGKYNNFDTDLFAPIIGSIGDISSKRYGTDQSTDTSIRVIADHIRAIAFVLPEGLMPSNEGRGYVLRRIIRRAARHGYMLGIEEPFLFSLLDAVSEVMSGAYPELLDDSGRSRKVLKFEEERFAHTLSSGMELLNGLLQSVRSSGERVIPGTELFKLYDTFGFPLDLAQEIASDNGIEVDEEGFAREMETQKSRARASWTGAETGDTGPYRDILGDTSPTGFLGYETLDAGGTVMVLIKDGLPVDRAGQGDDVEIVLDSTPFYGESGGQVGDLGTIRSEGLRVEVTNTSRFNNVIIHHGSVKRGEIRKGMDVRASVDGARRRAVMRNHTATHLLHTALRAVLGDHIKQSGSLVDPERLRFDFTHFYPVEDEEIHQIETLVNEKIMENLPVKTTVTTFDEAVSGGVTALFGEKYGEKVRVVRAGDFSAELCGGTHCSATGEIGPFRITSEGSVAAGLRRVEAITGFSTLEYMRSREDELKKSASILKVGDLHVSEKLGRMINESKAREKELREIKGKAMTGNLDDILSKVVKVNGVNVLSVKFEGLDLRTLRGLADKLKDRIGSGVILLGSVLNGQASFVSAVTKDMTTRFNAGTILREVTGGKGGGRADMAQGGTRDTERLDMAIDSLVDIIKKT